jgi:threonine synthase
MAQTVYYFYAALSLGAPHKEVAFSVPTGNFGDVFAGYLASRMGLPVHKLIVATNHNDILHRFFEENRYQRGDLSPSLSPSMDIQVASNFERLLYDVVKGDGAKVAAMMESFKTGAISVDKEVFDALSQLFDSARCDDATTLEIIRVMYEKTGETLDPHTATAVHAATHCTIKDSIPVVVLATAHPAKFPESIIRAGIPEPSQPEHLKAMLGSQERMDDLKAEVGALKDYILAKL